MFLSNIFTSGPISLLCILVYLFNCFSGNSVLDCIIFGWLLRPIWLYVRAVIIVHDLILCKTRISMCNFVGYIVAVDSVSPTVFIISEAGDLIKWFDCSDYMREPSDIAVSGREFFVCDFKVASSLSMYQKKNFSNIFSENGQVAVFLYFSSRFSGLNFSYNSV